VEQGHAARTVVLDHKLLRRALSKAVELDMVGRNVTDPVTPPKPQRREMATLSDIEVGRLLEVSKGTPYYTLWLLLVTTGLHRGEALALRWSDWDEQAGTIRVTRSLSPGKGGPIFGEVKTGHSRRTVHIAPSLASALFAHRASQNRERLMLGPEWHDNGLIFCGEAGKPLVCSTVHDAFKRHLEGAGIPSIRIHDLRHTAATWLLKQGLSPKVVAEMLGHANISITLDVYSHVLPSMRPLHWPWMVLSEGPSEHTSTQLLSELLSTGPIKAPFQRLEAKIAGPTS
jgi:integrase